MDGASRWQSFKAVTLPHLRPTTLLVITLGVIGTWQVFDQVYVMTQGGPSKTTLTPAYLSYEYAFVSQKWGVAAAMAFVLFLIIFVLTSFQRWLFRDKDAVAEKRAARARSASCATTASGPAPGPTCRPRSPPGTPTCREAHDDRSHQLVHADAPADDPRGSGRGTSVALLLGYAVLVLFSFIYLYPFVIQVATAFKTDSDAVRNALSLVPDPFTTAAFDRLLDTTSRAGSATRCSSRCW
jgi:ABC-type glycerol-3-phosphate transport system permease component